MLKTRIVLRFLQSRHRYSKSGMVYSPNGEFGVAGYLAKIRSGTRLESIVLASVMAVMDSAPAFKRVLAHSLSVVPVVNTRNNFV